MLHFILLSDDRTHITNQIHVHGNLIGLSITADKPENLIKLEETEEWNFQEGKVVTLSAEEIAKQQEFQTRMNEHAATLQQL